MKTMLNHFLIFSKNGPNVSDKFAVIKRGIRFGLSLTALASSFFLFCPSAVYASSPSIQLRLEVSPREITIGDIVDYKAVIVFSSQVTAAPIVLPEPWGTFELLDYAPSSQQTLPDGKISISHNFRITTFSTGTQTIPAIHINFSTIEGEQVQANTETVSIHVISLLEKYGDEGNLRPFRGPYNFKSYLWVWILAGIIGFIIGIYFLRKYLKSKSKTLTTAPKPQKPPEQIAWDAINALEDSNLLKENKIKEFYSRLSSILKQYLEDRYHVAAMEKTTYELMSESRKLKFNSEVSSILRGLLDNGDLVKFAKFSPQEDEVETDLARLKEIISLTTPAKIQKTKKEDEIPV